MGRFFGASRPLAESRVDLEQTFARPLAHASRDSSRSGMIERGICDARQDLGEEHDDSGRPINREVRSIIYTNATKRSDRS
jgi:hypothetical protein